MATLGLIDPFPRFADEVKRRSRFVRSREAETFLASLANTAGDRKCTLERDKILFRAQLGNDCKPFTYDDEEEPSNEPCPFGEKRMIPDPNRGVDNRANAKGIPCIYAASDPDTAMSEIRPWIGSYISLGLFRTARDLNLVDCSKNHEHSGIWKYLLGLRTADIGKPISPEKLNEVMWASIDYQFARPITRSDEITDYVPTQIIADLFRSLGFDGLVYKSKLSEGGLNYALFDLDSAEMLGCKLFIVKSVSLEFKEELGPLAKWGKTMPYRKEGQSR